MVFDQEHSDIAIFIADIVKSNIFLLTTKFGCRFRCLHKKCAFLDWLYFTVPNPRCQFYYRSCCRWSKHCIFESDLCSSIICRLSYQGESILLCGKCAISFFCWQTNFEPVESCFWSWNQHLFLTEEAISLSFKGSSVLVLFLTSDTDVAPMLSADRSKRCLEDWFL